MLDLCRILFSSGIRVKCAGSGLVEGCRSADGSARSSSANQWKAAFSCFVAASVVCPRTYVVVLRSMYSTPHADRS